ncbi:MAG: nuclear transport factor 2 family protein [Rhodospirillaceae bacterium]|nr:nuclear transport factor 2 family protein [Rhodospirillaceae bacterium]MCA8933921.1 nuclear transport factor 2 family protein [Rhodospirillaceae bacterium]
MTAEDMTPEDLWKRYAAIWFLDAERRPGELAACLADDASYCDPQHAAGGREALSAYMADVQQRVPGGRFEIRSVQHHHGRCLAQWELLSADDGLVLTGTSFASLAEDGRLSGITGFFHPDAAPAPVPA